MIFCGPGDPTIEDYTALIRTLERIYDGFTPTADRIYRTFRDSRDKEFRKEVMDVVRMPPVDPEKSDSVTGFDTFRRHILEYVFERYERKDYAISNDL